MSGMQDLKINSTNDDSNTNLLDKLNEFNMKFNNIQELLKFMTMPDVLKIYMRETEGLDITQHNIIRGDNRYTNPESLSKLMHSLLDVNTFKLSNITVLPDNGFVNGSEVYLRPVPYSILLNYNPDVLFMTANWMPRNVKNYLLPRIGLKPPGCMDDLKINPKTNLEIDNFIFDCKYTNNINNYDVKYLETLNVSEEKAIPIIIAHHDNNSFTSLLGAIRHGLSVEYSFNNEDVLLDTLVIHNYNYGMKHGPSFEINVSIFDGQLPKNNHQNFGTSNALVMSLLGTYPNFKLGKKDVVHWWINDKSATKNEFLAYEESRQKLIVETIGFPKDLELIMSKFKNFY